MVNVTELAPGVQVRISDDDTLFQSSWKRQFLGQIMTVRKVEFNPYLLETVVRMEEDVGFNERGKILPRGFIWRLSAIDCVVGVTVEPDTSDMDDFLAGFGM